MRALAADYVASDKFFACAPEALDWLHVRFDAALAVWVLQHCRYVDQDIERIMNSVSGPLFIVNDYRRLVPTRQHGWVNDGNDIMKFFKEPVEMHTLDEAIVGKPVAKSSYWAIAR